MMCYRLASELSDRIAAIAPVAGTMAIETAGLAGQCRCSTSTGPRMDLFRSTGPTIVSPRT